MPEENVNQEFRLEKINETRNYLIEEINQNALMSKKHKKVCRVLNYIEHLLIAISTIIGCVSTSAFASLVGIPIGIAIATKGLKIGAITTGTNPIHYGLFWGCSRMGGGPFCSPSLKSATHILQ